MAPHLCHIIECNSQTFVAKLTIPFYNIKEPTNVNGNAFHLTLMSSFSPNVNEKEMTDIQL